MTEPIYPRTASCQRCGDTGRLGLDLEVTCGCIAANANDALDREREEKQELVRTVDELSKVVVDLEAERELLRAQVKTLRAHRLKLIDALTAEASALQAAANLDRAKALFAVVREVADE